MTPTDVPATTGDGLAAETLAAMDVVDTVTATVRRCPAALGVIVCGDKYAQDVRDGALKEDPEKPPRGKVRPLSAVKVGERFAMWDETFEPAGWWVFEVRS